MSREKHIPGPAPGTLDRCMTLRDPGINPGRKVSLNSVDTLTQFGSQTGMDVFCEHKSLRINEEELLSD